MKYKTGDRFIIEIEEKLSTPRTALYKIKDFNSLVLAENELDRLVQEHDGSETGKTYPELLKVLEELPMNDMRGKESKMNEIERLEEIVRKQDELLECKEKIIQEQEKLMSKYEDAITFYRIFLLGLRDVIKEGCNAYSTDEESDSR